MADRYQDRPFPAAPGKGESDPLAELARLIGQTDPFANIGRANQRAQPHSVESDPYPPATEDEPAPAVLPWMQRGGAAAPQQDHPSDVHPLRRYAAPPREPDYAETSYAADTSATDPSRYDEALYGQLDTSGQDRQHEPDYADDPYPYQDGYDESAEEQPRKRGGGVVTVFAVVALAVLGTGAAFAYRTYIGSPRSGDPPIIRADTGPTKIIPAPADGSKVPDRLAAGDGTEKIVPREEAPVDVGAAAGPRVVLPPLNPNPNPPTVASVSPGAAPPATSANGTLPNNEPRKIKTLAVHGDAPDGAAAPVMPPAAAKPTARMPVATVPPRTPPSSANASANAPLSLSPQSSEPAAAAEPRTRMAATTTAPVQIAPAASAGGGGGYLVQVSSQRNEADAQASFRSLQGKFPGVLGSRSAVIKRADLGDKGVYYRAMVGPFGSPDEASQFCGNLKSAGGQCVVQRN